MSLFSIIGIAVAIPMGIACSAFIWFYVRLRVNQPSAAPIEPSSAAAPPATPPKVLTEALPKFQPVTSFLKPAANNFAIDYAPIDGELSEEVAS